MDNSRVPSGKVERLPIYCTFILGFLGAIALSVLFVWNVSASPAASLDLIFLPVIFLILFLIVGFVGYMIGIIIRGLKDNFYAHKLSYIFSWIITVPLIIYFVIMCAQAWILSDTINKIVENKNAEQLDRAFRERTNYYFSSHYQTFILGAIAVNPYASSELLDSIVHLDDIDITADLENTNIFVNFTPTNSSKRPIAELIAGNPHAKNTTLEYLMTLNDIKVAHTIAFYASSPDLLRMVYEKYISNGKYSQKKDLAAYQLILSALVRNPYTPSDIKELSKQLDPLRYNNNK